MTRHLPTVRLALAGVLATNLACAAFGQQAPSASRSFELLYVEHQMRFAPAPPLPVEVPGISFQTGPERSQQNRLALTFRAGRQVDYEAERNFGAIYQRNPTPEMKGHVHTQRQATGTIGEWFHVPSPYVDTIQMRVNTGSGGTPIVAELRAPNFTQIFEIVTDGQTCRAAIVYRLDPGATRFKMFSLKNGRPQELGGLAADHISCSVGTTDIF
jgi:hypothetical protein